MRWIDEFNRWPQAPIIFIILCINHFIPLPDANEEMYFGLALQYVDPSWIPGSFSFTEEPGTRLLFQYPVGWLLKFLTFEWVAILGRITSYAIFSVILTRIFAFLQLTNLFVVFFLQIIFNRNQSFLAGEWIFQDFETKTVAYVFILLSLLTMIKEKWKSAVLWTVPAVYFHVLVGGWYFIALYVYMFIRRLPIKSLLLYGSLFSVLVLPYLYFLSSQVLLDQRSVIEGVNLDWIYTYYRNPHHTVTFFMGWPWFRIHRFDGFIMLLAAIVLGIVFYNRASNSPVRNLWLFCFATYLVLLVGVTISAFDVNGKILKFYVYRIGTVSFLMTCILLISKLQNQIFKSKYRKILIGLMVAGCLISIPQVLYRKISRLPRYDPHYQQMISFISQDLKPGTKVLGAFDCVQFGFMRQTRCDLLITQKYVPSGGEKLYEWYRRYEDQQMLEKDWNLLPEIKAKYDIEYILTYQDLAHFDFLEKTKEEGVYHLYHIVDHD